MPAVNDILPKATGRHVFGYESLMFRYWHPAQLFSNQDILALSPSRTGLNDDLFVDKAFHVSQIKELSIQKLGKVVGTYYYRLLTSASPPVPQDIVMY